jgi:hypothetical protein
VTALRRFFAAREEHGQALVLLAIVMMTLLFATGLAIDAGQLYSAKRTQQEAADSAAFAGAVNLYLGGDATTAVTAATADATLNGFTTTPAGTVYPNCTICVTISSPPTTGAFAGIASYVEVKIVQKVKTSLVPAEAIFNPVTARGVGGSSPQISPYAVVLLKSTGPCITLSSGGSLVVPNPDANTGGQVYANCSGTSITSSGGGTVVDALGVTTVGTEAASTVTGPLTQSAPVVRDPFAGWPKPTIGTIVNNTPGTPYTVPISACNAATPLTPGTYVGGIKNNQDCSGLGGKVYLGNGVFILKGGGFNQNANSGTITPVAGGAMVFNTHTNYPGPIGAGSCTGLVAQQGGGFSFTAMTTGTYAGMAYYQDAACTNAINIQSNGSFLFYGTVYAPSAPVLIQSSATMTVDAQLVVSEIQFQGGTSVNLTVNYHKSASAKTGLPSLTE